MKTIVIGVGNPILSDDGVGIHVAQQVKHCMKNPEVTVEEAPTGGMNLLDLILGYDKAIIIDAVKTNTGRTGEVKRYRLTDISTIHSCNPHDVSLTEAITLAKKLGEEHIPQEIIIIGISLSEMPCEFGEYLSEVITAAVPKAVEMTLVEITNGKQVSQGKKQDRMNT
ncbi:MAG: hydrogenase maturation protease [Methanobacteriota archaeon]